MTTANTGEATATTAARQHLVRTIQTELIGPYHAEEELPKRPSHVYLTGYLDSVQNNIDEHLPAELADDDDEAEAPVEPDESDEAAANEEKASRRRRQLPTSLGLSLQLVPRDAPLRLTVQGATYVAFHREGEKATQRPHWRRQAINAAPVLVSLRQPLQALPVVELPGVTLEVHTAPTLDNRLAVQVFLVNRMAPTGKHTDTAMLFQVQLEAAYEPGLAARPALGIPPDDADADTLRAALQFRNEREYATGVGVATIHTPDSDGVVRRVATTWLPTSETPALQSNNDVGPGRRVEHSMQALAQCASADEIERALADLPTAYREWIATQQQRHLDDPQHAATRDALMAQASEAAARIRRGIDLLRDDADVRRAFCAANLAMYQQATQRQKPSTWYLFQLAFIVMNIPSAADEAHPERGVVELIYFPTGGGKTEAYLGLIAFTLLHRRQRGRTQPDKGLGVSVILRYTLRLLTLDQLSRATALICALELVRQQAPTQWGDTRFAVGLWVGSATTPNSFFEADKQKREQRLLGPLPTCPWCQAELDSSCYQAQPSKKSTVMVIGCPNPRCAFCRDQNPEGLPLAFIDEHIYNELPALVIATVDKFAMVPHLEAAGRLFGRVTDITSVVTPATADQKRKARRIAGLLPPSLYVQDELHLLTGPLGTMVGLFETAVAYLSSHQTHPPKIIASTATIRRAEAQISALMGRTEVRVFPPQGPDPGETFFSTTAPHPGRLYLGIAAPGQSFRKLQARVYQALLAGSQALTQGGHTANADAYMTLLGYFCNLRELGAMRRVVEGEVKSRLETTPFAPENSPNLLMASRTLRDPRELTSREKTTDVKITKDRLQRPQADATGLDVVLASNMISVGLDITRLGLMVMAGQPTTTAEYIQASSRVGRDAAKPGLVVTCYNVRRVRDRSYYERFHAFHQSMYGMVESASVTPYSAPALDRGLAAALVAMLRHSTADLAEGNGLRQLLAQPEVHAAVLAHLQHHGAATSEHASMHALAAQQLEAMLARLRKAVDDGREVHYSSLDKGEGLIDPKVPVQHPEPLYAPTSMRETEPQVHLWLKTRLGDAS